MARNLTANTLAELTKQGVKPVIFVEAEFTGGTINVWSGVGTITWDSKTWTGLGRLGTISPIGETADVRAEGIAIGLSGIPSDLVTKALDEVRPNKPVTVWLGFLDANDAVIADPYKSFKGKMDVPEIDEGGETSSIRITVESRLVDLNRARERRWTHEDQQLLYPGDLGFDGVAALQEWDGMWGRSVPFGAPANRPPGVPDGGPPGDHGPPSGTMGSPYG